MSDYFDYEAEFLDYLGQQDGQLGASPGDAIRRLRRNAMARNRKLEHKHETPEDRYRRWNSHTSKSFIAGVHDHQWQQGVPRALLAEYKQMEAQTSEYRDLRSTQ